MQVEVTMRVKKINWLITTKINIVKWIYLCWRATVPVYGEPLFLPENHRAFMPRKLLDMGEHSLV